MTGPAALAIFAPMNEEPTQAPPSYVPPQRYRVGFAGLKWLNGHLAGLGLVAHSAFFDKKSVYLHGDRTLNGATHELLPASGHGSKTRPAPGATALVPCTGLEPGKPRPETPFPVPFPDLLKGLWPDALVQPAAATSAHPVTRLDRFFRNPLHQSDWWKFHYPRNRLFCLETRMGDRYARVHHSTLECFRAYFRFLPSLELFNDEPFRPPSPHHNFATLLTYKDVLTGQTQRRLEEVLSDAASKDFEGILVRTTCVPDMVGDSPVHPLQKLAKQKGVAGHWVAKTHPTPNAIALILQQRLAELRNRPQKGAVRPVLLAGVETQPLADELTAVLSKIGLTVLENFLPNLVLQDPQERGSPEACIWTNSYGWDELLTDELLPEIPVIRTYPPYGIEATKAWLLRIAQTLDLQGAPDVIQELAAQCHAKLGPIRQQAACVPVALVGDKADLGVLTGRSPYSGWSLLAVLQELGFPVTLLLFRPEGSTASTTANGAVLKTFSSAEQLAGLLAEQKLVYSDFNVDSRLVAAGVQGFGSGLFDPGFDGLIRAGRLLLHRARHIPFVDFKPQLNAIHRGSP